MSRAFPVRPAGGSRAGTALLPVLSWRRDGRPGKRHFQICKLLLAATILAATATAPLAHAEEVGANRTALIRRLLPTVVNISVRKPEEVPDATSSAMVSASTPSNADRPVKTYVGSGFVIDPSGLIVTNYHVVQNAFEIAVMFSDGTLLRGTLKAASRLADIAVIKVQPEHPLTAVQWGDSTTIQVGDPVFAAGNPFGLGLSVSAGIVSALNRDIQDSPYDHLIQTDAPINHGNSGGPLFDMQGQVVGVDSEIISPTAGSVGVGFAIPSSTAQFVVDHLLKYGWVRPAWIGVKVQEVTPDLADALHLGGTSGSLVAWVLPGAPAAKAGIQIGDVIRKIGGRTPTDERDLLRDIVRTPIGDSLTLQVSRGGAERTVKVTTEEWPRGRWDRNDAPTSVAEPKIVIPPDLGLTLAAIPDNQKAALGLDVGVTGVLVKTVAANSDPVRRGVADGDVILRVADKAVTSPEDVQAAINAARTEKRDYVPMLILPKVRTVPGPKWVALEAGPSGT